MVPIVNENDTVAVEGDKIRRQRHSVGAGCCLGRCGPLAGLSDVEGVYSAADPRLDPDAQLVKIVTVSMNGGCCWRGRQHQEDRGSMVTKFPGRPHCLSVRDPMIIYHEPQQG